MPSGGGYATDAESSSYLKESVGYISAGYKPPEEGKSFCSSATYLVLLAALKKMEMGGHLRLGAQCWNRLGVTRLPDGHGPWGQWNANGPGAAGFINSSGLGYSFGEIEYALPGDFLKFFWTKEIGSSERGHLVVFLGTTEKDDVPHVRFWSSNRPEGMGIKEVPLTEMHHLVFSRLSPYPTLAIPCEKSVDEVLVRMKKERFRWEDVSTYISGRSSMVSADAPATIRSSSSTQ
jgi:hypothetical protein